MRIPFIVSIHWKVPIDFCHLTLDGFCNFVHKTRYIVFFFYKSTFFGENVILLLLQWSCFCVVGKLFGLYCTYSRLYFAVTFRKVLRIYILFYIVEWFLSKLFCVCWVVRNVPYMFVYVYVFGMRIHSIFLPFVGFYIAFEVTILKK